MTESSNKISTVQVWFGALRVHQWPKNLLIFIPLLAAHEVTNLDLAIKTVAAFAIFCLLASAVYILNDIKDVYEDKLHPTKGNRPIASGNLSIHAGYISAAILIGISIGAAYSLLGLAFFLVTLSYLLITTIYTYLLRRYWILDVVTLALLYTIRIIAGGVSTGLELTFWILAFSMFIFFSLAMVKRFAELRHMSEQGLDNSIYGRGYIKEDMGMIASMGSASGYIAVAVMALYINDLSASVLYKWPQVIWLSCPVMLYWITRIWMLASRGLITNDPLVFALKDKGSLIVGIFVLVIFWVAT